MLPGLQYCNAELEANELASLILSIFDTYNNDSQFGGTVSEKAKAVFCSKEYIEYFDALIG